MIRYMFLRDVNREPIGCIAINVHRATQALEYQVSVVNKVDRFNPLTGRALPFNKEVARMIAAGRLVENGFRVDMPSDATMNQISTIVMKDLANLTAPRKKGDISTRAIKAAKLWLKTNAR
jgi:hypothetical protein